MADNNISEELARIFLTFNVPSKLMWDMTPMEVILGESLLTPGLQTSVRVHSYQERIEPMLKNLDHFKGCGIGIKLVRPILKRYGFPEDMDIFQVVYRIDNRKLISNNIQEFILHACDQSLLNDAAHLVSKFWSCTSPTNVTEEVLQSCAGVRNLDTDGSLPMRDYTAENIHPFQVVAQQAQAALYGDSPSFVHYMTYENLGTHHFRALDSLTKAPSLIDYTFDETGQALDDISGGKGGYAFVKGIMTYSFPCDFDLLSDILNGIDTDGKDINTAFTFNPLMKMFNQFGNSTQGCGMGGGVAKLGLSNMGSAQQQNACPDYSHVWLQKRQARMALLEQDKIAIRLTVPWNPALHAGKIITVKLYVKDAIKQGRSVLNYGSGDYLIVSLTHNLKYGGFAITTMDCVTQTVGSGGAIRHAGTQ